MAINRRDALKSMALLMGGTIVGMNALLTGCSPEEQLSGLNFSEKDIAFLDELGEAIIPTTDTPGAKAAEIGTFMVMMVKDTYNAAEQEKFTNGLNALRADFKKQQSTDFMEASTADRTAYLNALQARAAEEEALAGFLAMAKDLTVLGYFTSEIGATQALRYMETPGKYDGCMEYVPGDRAWAL
ncbi:gluconate 2-dehydrogenase subunit 3 family protein [Nitritalea halalkaliphila]|nr:gluconate 2-dehydrogenase subunit 3 family protein [Nitritalea halalkaliphila]